jgi:two-component system, OmpR family, phosphate regulon sensor histidine kinase PhoR
VKLRRVYPLVILFVFVPAALMLTVGILILVYGSVARDYLFGGLILALVTTTIIGTAATLAVLYREAQVARLQTDFVNKVSHDLRTPLTSIRMFVETLQLGRIQDPARQSEALEIIADETGRLSALINRLLDWARMESGRRSYELRRQPVAPIVDAALVAFGPQLLLQPAEVTRNLPDDLPPVWADREAVTEALLNLLNNAHKYTGDEKKIEVSALQEGELVVIEVKDNGPGIPQREQKRVFDKFYRGSDPLQRSIEGTGLGLAMVKHIVAGHGGRVSVESELGHGARFRIALQAAPVQQPAQAAAPAAAAALEPRAARRS